MGRVFVTAWSNRECQLTRVCLTISATPCDSAKPQVQSKLSSQLSVAPGRPNCTSEKPYLTTSPSKIAYISTLSKKLHCFAVLPPFCSCLSVIIVACYVCLDMFYTVFGLWLIMSISSRIRYEIFLIRSSNSVRELFCIFLFLIIIQSQFWSPDKKQVFFANVEDSFFTKP